LSFGENNTASKIDSLYKVIDKKTGTDKISSQLDFALEIAVNDKEEARKMASSAYLEAKTSGNKNLLMRSFYTLGRIYMELDNINISEAYFDTALVISEAIDDNWNKGEILYRIGLIKHRKGQTVQALESFNASVQSCRLSNNFKTAGSSFSMLGTIFRMNGMYDRAIEYIIKSKLNYEKADFVEGSGWAAYLLGRIYYDLQLPQKALEYFHESLEIYKVLTAVDANQGGLAICYEQLGIINLEAGNFEEARKYIDYTLVIFTATESKYGLSNVYMNLGKVEYYKGNYAQAENYLNKSLQMKKEIDDLIGQPRIYEYLGLCLLERGNTKEGFKYIQQGLDLAISNNQKKIQLDIYERLTNAYLNINDFKNAIVSQNKQIEIQNSILSGAANIKTEQLQAIYEIDEQNNQIAELEKQNKINELSIQANRIIRNIMVSGIILVLLVTLVLYWFYNKIKRKNHELFEANAAKDKFFAIIAHDLRGPTSSLAALIEHINSNFNEYTTSELKTVLQILYKSAENVSNLLENLLIWAHSQVDKIEFRPAEMELDGLIQAAIKSLNQTAENKQINIRVESKDQIFVLADPDMVQTIVRNILNNAIKFTHRGGFVVIQTEVKKKNTATVKIIDNGIGIEKAYLSKIFEITNKHHTLGTEDEKSTGLGLILVKDFVEKNKGTLSIESEKNKGTIVSFTLPVTRVPS
jgi:signal transduction histidine kinase